MKYAPLLISSWVLFFFLYTGYNLFIALGIALMEYAIFDIGLRVSKNK
jgi:hypothetical protein